MGAIGFSACWIIRLTCDRVVTVIGEVAAETLPIGMER